MAGNRSLRCSKVILHPDSISKTILSLISENRKKIDFSIFDLWVTTMMMSKFRPAGRISAKICPDPHQIPQAPFPKKWSNLAGTHSGCSLHFVVWLHFRKNAYFGKVLLLLRLLRFGVPRCCFSKSSTSGLSEKYMVYGVISSQ